MYRIAITNEQRHPLDEERLRQAVRSVLAGEGVGSAKVSVAVVDDTTIHRLNREYLKHDEPTDVLSFLLDQNQQTLEGEVVISAETAARAAVRFGWTTGDELLLYVVHGTLHLLGHDDREPKALHEMRDRERHYLNAFGLKPRYGEVA